MRTVLFARNIRDGVLMRRRDERLANADIITPRMSRSAVGKPIDALFVQRDAVTEPGGTQVFAMLLANLHKTRDHEPEVYL